MVAGELRAIVATGSLDLGIDWGDVDLVVQVGAPKNVKRLVQRIGRANHRYNAPSRAVLVPANRFEVLECRAALDAVRARTTSTASRAAPARSTCSASTSCSPPAPARSTPTRSSPRCAPPAPTARLARADFDACLDFCATGGYALRAYDRWQRLVRARRPLAAARPAPRPRHPHERRHHRRHRDAQGAAQGPRRRAARRDRGGLRRLADPRRHLPVRRRDRALRGPARDDGRGDPPALAPTPKIAVFMGTKLATSTLLSHRVVELLADPDAWARPARLHAATGWRLQARGQPPAAARTGCWSRPSRAASASTSASTASPAATPTRPSACWSPGAWRRPASTRSASSPTTTRC